MMMMMFKCLQYWYKAGCYIHYSTLLIFGYHFSLGRRRVCHKLG